MTELIKQDLRKLLLPYGQEHLVAHWDHLDRGDQEQLASQIRDLDLEETKLLFEQATHATPERIDWSQVHPAPVHQLPVEEADEAEAIQQGSEALRSHQVAVVLVAGGKGSRLGFAHPKGLFPIGSVSGRSLLEVLIDRIEVMSDRYETMLPLFLMTSPDTHAPIETFLQQQGLLDREKVPITLFCQEQIPAVDRHSGRILMSSPGLLALSPNGHGGMLSSFTNHGCLADIIQRGVKYLFYGQIDNPLLPICDPRLIGHHVLAESEMSTHVVRKTDASERVGVGVLVHDTMRIIEYSHLPETVSEGTTSDGHLQFWAGSMGSHLLNTTLLERSAADTNLLPYHAMPKAVSCLDDDAVPHGENTLNAFKFERFIFELASVARNPIMVEVDRRAAFAPVKNDDATGRDSPATARQIMTNLYRSWLTSAGLQVAPDIDLEIHPRWALDQHEVAARITGCTKIDTPTFFHP
jgi:UDP-N-acetylglucosamine/UDP-N-acetylgalactosamine diphosphorylase